jgi:dihydroorotate dehydrogenase
MGKSLHSTAYQHLHKLPPELAHKAAILGLKFLPPYPLNVTHDQLKVNVLGIDFPNPIGLAAGFDKSAKVTQELLNLGFGFVEVGTITPWRQSGNPKPRLFRLTEDDAIINRMGFNNDGSTFVRMHLLIDKVKGVFGINIGPNSETTDYLEDFKSNVRTFAPIAKYITINVSSPNTVGLRDLQEKDALSQLLFWVISVRDQTKIKCPILVKISPDITLLELDDIIDVALFRGIDGLIIANTTTKRPDSIISHLKIEPGGLSGPSLFNNTVKMLAHAYNRITEQHGNLILIGSGGVNDGKSALAQIMAGASLVQIYTSFIYHGPDIISSINLELLQLMKNLGVDNISKLVGVTAKQ